MGGGNGRFSEETPPGPPAAIEEGGVMAAEHWSDDNAVDFLTPLPSRAPHAGPSGHTLPASTTLRAEGSLVARGDSSVSVSSLGGHSGSPAASGPPRKVLLNPASWSGVNRNSLDGGGRVRPLTKVPYILLQGGQALTESK